MNTDHCQFQIRPHINIFLGVGNNIFDDKKWSIWMKLYQCKWNKIPTKYFFFFIIIKMKLWPNVNGLRGYFFLHNTNEVIPKADLVTKPNLRCKEHKKSISSMKKRYYFPNNLFRNSLFWDQCLCWS